MANKIILEDLNGEIACEATTKDIRGDKHYYVLWWQGRLWAPTDRIRDDAKVFVELRTPKDPITAILLELIPITTSPADTSPPASAP